MKRIKRLLTSLIISLPSFALMAFESGSFIAEMKSEGYNTALNNQDINIALFVIGILMLVLTLIFTQRKSNRRLTLISSTIAILVASGLNMLFAAYYFYYIAGVILLVYDICKYFSNRTLHSKIFVNLVLYLAITIIGGKAISDYEYNKCNIECIPPYHYGLNWRPFYEGFTDEAYFGRIEKKITECDSTKALKELLEKNIAAVTYDFPILKSKGWEIFDGNNVRCDGGYRVFISPAKKIIYILEYRNNGFDAGHSWVNHPENYFSDFSNAEYYFTPGLLIALAKDSDSTRLQLSYLNGLEDYCNFPNFISIKDSVLNLPDYDEIDARNRFNMADTATMAPIRDELFNFNHTLSFRSSDVKKISFDQNLIKIRFNDTDSTERIYAVNIGDLIDKKNDRLIRFKK